MPRCQSRPAPLPALLLAGVLTSLATPVTPAGAADLLWSYLSAAGTPGGTSGGWVVFDSRRGRFVHHAGDYYSAGRYCFGYIHPDGTYAVSPDGWAWQLMVPDGALPPRSEASAVYDSLGDRVILFGGYKGGYLCISPAYEEPAESRNDVWVLDASGQTPWTELVTAGTRPAPRDDASMVLDTRRHRLLVFGGRGASGQALDELWELTLDGAPGWRRIPTVPGPSRRSGHAAVYDPRRDRMVIACGVDSSGAFLGDVWAYDPGTEAWSQSTPGGPAPDGPTAGAYDAAGDQMLTVSTSLSSDRPARLRTLGLAPGSAWDTTTIVNRTDGSWGPNINFHNRISVAMSSSPRALLMLWLGDAGFMQRPAECVIARFQPVEKFIMQVADPTPIYTTVNLLPAPSLLWQTQANRPPYGLVRFRNTTSGFEATAVPDSTGAFRFHEPPPAPGSRYAYRVSWFDGEAERDTGDFVIDAAPHPQDIGFAFGPVSIRGRDVVVRFGASDDSARMLSRQMLQRRFPPGDWQDVWDILFPVDTIYVEPSVSPRSLVEFRAGWGDPVARTWSAPVQVQMNPEPVFRSVAWTQGVVDIRYTIEPGYPFAGSIYRAGPLEPGFVLVGPAVAAADGSIHVQDATVPRDIVPVQYEYHLEWNVGGVVVGDEAHPVMLPAVARVAILDLTNPARDAISFSVEVRDAGPCRAEVYDVNGRRIWQETFGGPGTHPVTLRGPAGLYFVRIVRGKMTESKRVVLIQ